MKLKEKISAGVAALALVTAGAVLAGTAANASVPIVDRSPDATVEQVSSDHMNETPYWVQWVKDNVDSTFAGSCHKTDGAGLGNSVYINQSFSILVIKSATHNFVWVSGSAGTYGTPEVANGESGGTSQAISHYIVCDPLPTKTTSTSTTSTSSTTTTSGGGETPAQVQVCDPESHELIYVPENEVEGYLPVDDSSCKTPESGPSSSTTTSGGGETPAQVQVCDPESHELIYVPENEVEGYLPVDDTSCKTPESGTSSTSTTASTTTPASGESPSTETSTPEETTKTNNSVSPNPGKSTTAVTKTQVLSAGPATAVDGTPTYTG
ncbi:hypothetical protein [Demequina capsici]|uniref:Uncharacterized protein n=1 Tax=Demequina capsici TaxID=3075620 RepID=A0AA96F7V2_9MICO|nr:hypothetical protein [Demequina sp. OYTSA14]WNM24889.1 hypothetical protein RN606_01695 [Demequina sp. OYTSA14]